MRTTQNKKLTEFRWYRRKPWPGERTFRELCVIILLLSIIHTYVDSTFNKTIYESKFWSIFKI